MLGLEPFAVANIQLNLYRDHGNTVLGEVTLDQAYGGARGVKCLVWEVRRGSTGPHDTEKFLLTD